MFYKQKIGKESAISLTLAVPATSYGTLASAITNKEDYVATHIAQAVSKRAIGVGLRVCNFSQV